MLLKKFCVLPCRILILMFLLGGCSVSDYFQKDSLTDSAYVWVNQSARIDVIEARSNDEQVLIKFRSFLKDSDQSQIFFAKAKWGKNALLKISLDKNVVLNLEFIDEASWKKEAAQLPSTVVLAENHWEDFQNELNKAVAPEIAFVGSLVKYDFNELVYYHDFQGDIQIVEYKDKPLEVTIEKTYNQTEFTRLIISTLEKYLKKNDLRAETVLLTVQSSYDDQQTFLYVDILNAMAVSLRTIHSDQSRYLIPVSDRLNSADQIILEGQVIGVATRPFSSAFRLYSWVKGSAVHSIKPQKWIPQIFSSEPIPALNDGLGMNLDDFEKELDNLLGNTRSSGTIRFLIGGDQFFPEFEKELRSAHRSIDLRTFIFDNDDYAIEIANLLKLKSKEKKMSVRILLDGIGTIMGQGATPANLPSGFTPPASIVKYLSKGSDINVRVRPNAWFKADHTKTIIIDEKICYTGGMNIGREYRYDWHDLMMELRGPIILEILHEFDIAWAHADRLGDISYLVQRIKYRRPNPEMSTGGIPIRPLYTRADDPQIFNAQMAAIKQAKKYIYISNAYFSDNNIINGLLEARRRGVDVRVILPVNGNHEIMNKNNIVIANLMFENGIKVYFYPRMSHIKAAVYDGWFCSGSANFDKLSFVDNLEFNIATSDPETVQRAISELFEPDFKKSMLMTEPLESDLKDRIAKFLAGQL
ncbi:MAG: phosphatidylserine/phosphatidylglycerophosphate/cardiolipin synthase family protein [Candidatus Omnitrophica bacterium]|nr:phosphatidylserine/phosphatidylglycerophosphate/cardiolipin synthase family protein [Candidatus Omnitrophota bacterium]